MQQPSMGPGAVTVVTRLEAPLIAELRHFKVGQLLKRALAEGVAQEDVDEAFELDKPKEAMIVRIMSKQVIGCLIAQAQAAGVDQDAIDDALEEDNPKDAIVRLMFPEKGAPHLSLVDALSIDDANLVSQKVSKVATPVRGLIQKRDAVKLQQQQPDNQGGSSSENWRNDKGMTINQVFLPTESTQNQGQILQCTARSESTGVKTQHVETQNAEAARLPSSVEVIPAGLPTKGSAGHLVGTCKPCAFVHTKGCRSGYDCKFCHLCGPERKHQKQRRGAIRGLGSLHTHGLVSTEAASSSYREMLRSRGRIALQRGLVDGEVPKATTQEMARALRASTESEADEERLVADAAAARKTAEEECIAAGRTSEETKLATEIAAARQETQKEEFDELASDFAVLKAVLRCKTVQEAESLLRCHDKKT